MTRKVSHHPASEGQAEARCIALASGERRLIDMIVDGYTNRSLARHFSVCERTIYRRIARLCGKLGVSNRFELMLFAIDHGIVSRT